VETEPIQARLTIRLLANDVIVAETANASLWQATLARIMGYDSPPETSAPAGMVRQKAPTEEPAASGIDARMEQFAQQLGVETDALIGSLGPSDGPPYIYLDMGAWEAFRNNTPARGRGSVAPLTLAATALVLWFRAIGQGNPTQAQAHAVLATINLRDKNPTRSLANCDWLQNRNGTVLLNPQFISRARGLLTAFINREEFKE
jgi:hypothetical protein